MDRREAWEVARQIIGLFMAQYGSAMDNVAISIGLEPSQCFVVIIPAHLFEPDPISIARLRKKVPYNSPIYYEEPLRAVKEAGFLDEVPEGGYVLNQKGHEAFRSIMCAAYQQMEKLSPLPPAKLETLKFFLARLVQASILSSEPTHKWSILHSRRLDPGRNASPIILIDQYLADLSAYRDDSHLASWSSYAVSAHAWDVLGLLWQGKATSIGDVIEPIKPRRWTESETRQAVQELVLKGWVSKGEKLGLTRAGREARENSERLTDRFFFSPWSILREVELEQFCELLTQLRKNLTELRTA